MEIGLVYNIRHVKPDLKNPQYLIEAEFDELSTIKTIVGTLRELGHKVHKVEADQRAYMKLASLRRKIDLVFNIAEGMHGKDREAQIPAILEILKIPYTGPRPLIYALGLDKARSKEIMLANKIPTPRWQKISCLKDLKYTLIKFPAIIKPNGEGSSKGIHADNLVKNSYELRERAKKLLKIFPEGIIVEKYLAGREFTVAILGTPPKVLPLIEVTFNHLSKDLPKFDHFEAKWLHDEHKGDKPNHLVCPARLDKKLEKLIKDTSLKTFAAFEISDWARIDLRLDNKGIPNIIEVNCPPGIVPNPEDNSRFPLAARKAGLSYNKMLERILQSACRRYSIVYK
ncbi:MAG: D-alanine--D-alanine ligase [Patescibacteria group bacterium]